MSDEPLLPKIEEKILKFWSDRDIFKKSLQNRINGKRFVFFEGPPTANARSHIGHFMGRAFKDLFVRYKTMRGYLVERKAGWDTHGLPVEIEVEKALGLKNKKDIEAYGIAKFNVEAKKSVWKYITEWEELTQRMGFWLDMEHPYITYETSYIETLWWVIKEIDSKKLLYEGHKVLPWCTRCGTALSSHEVAQGYEDVTDTSVYVKFKLKPGQKIGKALINDDTYILAWTTTPWTLPGNLALAVGKNIEYVITKNGDEHYILADASTGVIRDKEDNPKLVIIDKRFTGRDLVGLKYEPLFDVPALKSDKSYQVYPADFVTTTDGTGVVHTAVMYGVDDYELGKKIGLPKVHTVDEAGRFNQNVKELAGLYVKASKTEQAIIEYLKSRNLLFGDPVPYQHSYPFCWRCKTALLYYAKDSWFVDMPKIQKQLIKNNRKVNWVPEHLKEGRFGEWLQGVKDWALARERYWGTPLPVWRCQHCNSYQVAGSLEDLEKGRTKPKNSFILLRHATSTRGSDGEDLIISSKSEHDKYNLTADGVRFVKEQAELLRKQGGVDLIVASPFLRTKETAKIIADQLGMQYTTDERLKELDHGLSCEGQPKSACADEENRLTMDSKSEDSESWREARRRMFKVATEFDDKYEGKKILIVSHGDPLWLLETGLMNFDDARTVASRNSPLYLGQGEFHQVDFKNWPYDEDGSVNLHRPYIDEVFLKCEKCGGESKRVKEVVDAWFDSGSMPYAQWHYPFENKKEFEQNFPADFISEGIDQTRGWFYTLLAVSTLLGKGAPYKNVVSQGHVLDSRGKKMSKSIGNVVDPQEIMKNYGADPARWYFYSVNDVGEPKLFSLADSMKQPKAFIGTILNSLNFFELYNQPSGHQIKLKPKPQRVLDEWLLSRLNNTLVQVTKSLDRYDPTSASRGIESFVVDDLSNWWIRRSRELFQRPESKKSFQNTVHFLQYVLVELSKMTAPFMPFLSDHVYKRLGSFRESVHLEDWPKAKKRFINTELEKQMAEVRNVIAVGLAQRKNNNIKVRQPLAMITIKRAEKFDLQLEQLIMAELNIKKVLYNPTMADLAVLDIQLTQELILEGYARELMRQIQDMRKEAKYKIDDRVFLSWESDSADIISAFEKFSDEITKTTALKQLSHGRNDKLIFDVQKEFELTSQVKIWLGIRR